MPFGLKRAPTTFQRMMDRILGDCCKYAAAYLDDVIIFSRDWNSHLKHIKDVFDRLSRAGLTVKRKKCQFAPIYLGHVVGCGLVRPETAKVEAIRDFKVPQTKKDVRAFLGLVGYYRKFIPNFAEISACLTDLTKNIAPARVRWQPQHQTAFNKLKLSLQKEPILVCPARLYQTISAPDRCLGQGNRSSSQPERQHRYRPPSRFLTIPKGNQVATPQQKRNV